MRYRSARSLLLVMLATCLGLMLPACGGGGSAVATPGGSEITAVAPSEAFALESTLVRIAGRGLPPAHEGVRVRLTAVTGTPFEGGTRASIEFVPTTARDFEIEGLLPATHVTQPVEARVSVIGADGVLHADEADTLTLRPQGLDRLDITRVAADTQTRLTLHGRGFHPVGRVAEVAFTPLSGPGFQGGGSATATATITSPTTATVFSPDVRVFEEVEVAVGLTLPSGVQLSTDTGSHLTITPVPFLQAGSPARVFARERTPFLLTGYGFTDGAAGKERATLRLFATSGTPFDGGRSNRVEALLTIHDTNRLEATLPPMDLEASVTARAVLTRPDGSVISSTEPVLQIDPQRILSVSPPIVTHEDAGAILAVEGMGFVPGAGEAVLRVRAERGTPFFRGTAATFEIPMTLTGIGGAQGVLPAVQAWTDVDALITLVLPSGLELEGGDVRLAVRSRYAAFDAKSPVELGDEPSAAVAVADFDGNGSVDVVFAHADRGPYVHLNDGAGAFPLELREELSGTPGLRLFARNFDRQAAADILMAAAGSGDGGGGGGGGRPKAEFAPEASADHRLYLNDGAAFFNGSRSLPPSSRGRTTGATLADIDGDGRHDLIVAYADDTVRGIEIWRDTGWGSFSLMSRETSSIDLVATDVIGVAAGDFNQDGRTDIAVLGRDSGIEIWRQTTRQEFVSEAVVPGGLARTIEAADLDRDGDLDLVVGTGAGVSVFENRNPSSFGFVAGTILTADLVNRILLEDVDKDGDLDLLVARGEGEDTRSVLLFDNEGSMIFSDSGLRTPPAATRDVALGDIDGDGMADLILAQETGKQVFLRTR